jgi:hypothetical protein
MLPEGGVPQQLLAKHKRGRQIIDCSNSHYWGLVRAGKIIVVGKGRGSRAYLPSILRYVDELLAEAKSGKAA